MSGRPSRLISVDLTEVADCSNAYSALAQYACGASEYGIMGIRQGSKILTLLQPVVHNMLCLDRHNARELLCAWQEYFATLGLRDRAAPPTIEEYIPFRSEEFGCHHWLAMLRFSMDLPLTDEKMVEVQPIVSAAMASVILTNDW